MELPALLVALAASAVAVHVARYWQPLAFVVSVAATGGLIWAINHLSSTNYELLGLTFGLQPLARDFFLVAVTVSGCLAVATSLGGARRSLGFLFWSWIAWLVALAVNDFVIGVFAWASGLAVIVIAMEPRRHQRVGGAAYFLVLIVVGAASLLLAHRFIELYPLTPDQVSLVQSSILFLAWGLGLLLALVPFQGWLGPMSDEAPPPIIALLLGLGQPVGLWLLYYLIGQYPRLVEQSELLPIMAYGGTASILIGGILAVVERRAERLMSALALFSLGFILLDLSRGSLEGTANSILETFSRVIGLGVMAASLTVAHNVNSYWVKRLAVVTFVLGGFSLVGLRFGTTLNERWNLLMEQAATNQMVFYGLMLAMLGALLGIVRYAGEWLGELEYSGTLPIESTRLDITPLDLRDRFRQNVRAAWQRLVDLLPSPVRRAARFFSTTWRIVIGFVLLLALSAFIIWYSWTPNRWFEHALQLVTETPFLQ